MMIRELGLSALFLFSLLASSVVAEPDTTIKLKADLKIKPESSRIESRLEYVTKPINYEIGGRIQAISADCFENSVLITSDTAEMVAFYPQLGYNYNRYQCYGGVDVNGQPISLPTPIDFKMWNNAPSAGAFQDKSGLAANFSLPRRAERPFVARMSSSIKAAEVEALAIAANQGGGILRYLRPRIEDEVEIAIEQVSSSASTGLIDWFSEAFGALVKDIVTPELIQPKIIPLFPECATPLATILDNKAAAVLAEANDFFDQTSVYVSGKGYMFVFDQATQRVGYAKGLNKAQDETHLVPGQEPSTCGPITWCPCSVFGNCDIARLVDRDNLKAGIDLAAANTRLTMMTLCDAGHRTVLALAFDDGRIFMYDPFQCGVLNVVERRCRCTRNEVFPVWMEWCCRTNRLIVQYEKRETIIADQKEAAIAAAVAEGRSRAEIAQIIAELEAYDIDHFAIENSNGNRIRPNRYFVNIYKFDDVVRFASEPVLEYTLRSCKIQFVRYCCCSGHLFVVLADGSRSIVVVFDNDMRVIARKQLDSYVEKIAVSCCLSKIAIRLGCECVVHIATTPVLVREQERVIANPQQLHVLCIRKVLDSRINLDAKACLEIDGLIDVTAYARARAVADVEIPLSFLDDREGDRR